MKRSIWLAVKRPFRRAPKPLPKLTVVMTTKCRDRIPTQLRGSIQQWHEGIIYFIGLTTGTTTLALSGVVPRAASTPGSVDVAPLEVGKIVRAAAESGLQVVGQLHTHPGDAYHSQGDLAGMRIRYPGYFSIVVPKYGTQLTSFHEAHTLMWTASGFQEVQQQIKLFDGLGS